MKSDKTDKMVSAAVPFVRSGGGLATVPLPTITIAPLGRAEDAHETAAPSGVPDLSETPKVIFLIGRGGSGKTMLARWIADRMAQRGGGAIIGELDPDSTSLGSWVRGVVTPDSSDGLTSSRWLGDLLGHVVDTRTSALVNFGGGDTTLRRMVAAAPGLAEAVRERGVELVASYVMSPRIDDLAPLIALEAAGFKPRATMLVLNEGRVDEGVDRREAFIPIKRHACYAAAVERGAVPVWMPKLAADVAQNIEIRRLQFTDAGESGAFGFLARLEITAWLQKMERAFAPVHSWLL